MINTLMYFKIHWCYTIRMPRCMLRINFSMNMDRAGANADCYSMLERNENWIEDWFETDPDSKGKRYFN